MPQFSQARPVGVAQWHATQRIRPPGRARVSTGCRRQDPHRSQLGQRFSDATSRPHCRHFARTTGGAAGAGVGVRRSDRFFERFGGAARDGFLAGFSGRTGRARRGLRRGAGDGNASASAISAAAARIQTSRRRWCDFIPAPRRRAP